MLPCIRRGRQIGALPRVFTRSDLRQYKHDISAGAADRSALDDVRESSKESASTHESLSDVNLVLKNFVARKDHLQQRATSRNEALQHRAALERARRASTPDSREQAIQHIPRITSMHLQHHDLASYLVFCQQNDVNTDSTVHKGTLYEYVVAEALKRFSITLERRGKAGDLGIDLLGSWKQPPVNGQSRSQRLFVQCKLSKPLPALIRELEGTYVGAPAGWKGDSTLGLLASSHEASPGACLAITRSDLPLGFVQVTKEGIVKQFIWNDVARSSCLPHVGVTYRYGLAEERIGKAHRTSDKPLDGSIALTWQGQPWPVSR